MQIYGKDFKYLWCRLTKKDNEHDTNNPMHKDKLSSSIALSFEPSSYPIHKIRTLPESSLYYVKYHNSIGEDSIFVEQNKKDYVKYTNASDKYRILPSGRDYYDKLNTSILCQNPKGVLREELILLWCLNHKITATIGQLSNLDIQNLRDRLLWAIKNGFVARKKEKGGNKG